MDGGIEVSGDRGYRAIGLYRGIERVYIDRGYRGIGRKNAALLSLCFAAFYLPIIISLSPTISLIELHLMNKMSIGLEVRTIRCAA